MFNLHANHTSDGVLIVEGLRVTDYNRNATTVVADRDCQDWKCCQDEEHKRRNDFAEDRNPHGTACNHDHWFTTENGGMFNGSRLESRP